MIIKILLRLVIVSVLAAGIVPVNAAEKEPMRTANYLSLTLEELMDIEVTTPGKKEQEWFKTPSAVYVLSQEDIRRSGVTSIAEALRMVPGMNVASQNAHTWAITARGFNDIWANKLLVMIDGRTVYTPIFSGVYWDVQDTLLEDIDRIEVIRGPGGTLWGANAVNGIVNVITKNAKDTQGGLITGGGGTKEWGFTGDRYGGKIGDNCYYRVYGKYFYQDHWTDADGRSTNDAWQSARGGFRLDWDVTEKDQLTLSGDGYYNREHDAYSITDITRIPFMQYPDCVVKAYGTDVLMRWNHTFSEDHDMALQLYYDFAKREEPGAYTWRVDTLDIDFQYRFSLARRHEITWGAGYRLIKDKTDGTFTVSFDPADFTQNQVTGFVQDVMTLVPERFFLIGGCKFERNEFTGFEYQPTGRLLWTPDERHTFWGAVTRAVRTPSRFDDALRANIFAFPEGEDIMVFPFWGDKDFKSEDVLTGELGYRVQPWRQITFDITGFYNRYNNLLTFEDDVPFIETSPVPHLVIPYVLDNKMYGDTYGIELASNYDVLDCWRLKGGFSWLNMDLKTRNSSTDTVTIGVVEGQNPKLQFNVRSYLDLPCNLQFDVMGYFVNRLSSPDIPAYFRLDLRLGWRPVENLEVSVVAQNLLKKRHAEFRDEYGGLLASEPPRAVYGKVTWDF